MDKIDFRRFSDNGFALRLDGPPGFISVDTLSESTLGLTKAIKEINKLVNPEYALEVYVGSVSPGSITINLKLKKAALAIGLLGGVALAPLSKDIVVALLSNYLYDKLTEEPCLVDIRGNRVRIKGDNCDITISKDTYDMKQEVDANVKVADGVKRSIQALKKDHAVESIAVIGDGNKPPTVKIPRHKFDYVEHRLNYPFIPSPRLMETVDRSILPTPPPQTRTIIKRVNLIIIKAVLKRSKRKWQFNWNGLTISAEISDQEFFDSLEKRDIALHQGDGLDAELAIIQRYLQPARVWENTSYAVNRVYAVTLGEHQTKMEFNHYGDGHTPKPQHSPRPDY
ncbi:hypothetical protein [Filomicrobium sp.]|uniref:hypothetical protein n=1 Tax=Filomicrobium sp. TaxID=2024831 RepID=UPI002582F078|nr:hypothetical protein [Filomicrobium sp.]MCV0371462.1 hypothetical protein [Filomicrobium sp.]